MKLIVLAMGLCGLSLAAGAQVPTAAPQSGSEAAMEASGRDGHAEAGARNCLRETGTRIRPRSELPDRTASAPSRLASRSESGDADRGRSGCVNALGRSYSRDDLERTGHSNMADALRMLDPAVN